MLQLPIPWPKCDALFSIYLMISSFVSVVPEDGAGAVNPEIFFESPGNEKRRCAVRIPSTRMEVSRDAPRRFGLIIGGANGEEELIVIEPPI